MLIDLDAVEQFMKDAHGDQRRSNGSLYFTHPLSVMQRLRDCGIEDTQVLATALLHDVLEDTNKSITDIVGIAGPEVAEAVLQLTIPIGPRMQGFTQKNLYMFIHAKEYNDIAKRVKLADRIDNLMDARDDWKPERTRQYAVAGLALISIMLPVPKDVQYMVHTGIGLIQDILTPDRRSAIIA